MTSVRPLQKLRMRPNFLNRVSITLTGEVTSLTKWIRGKVGGFKVISGTVFR